MCIFKNLCAQCACKAYKNQRLPGALELELQTFVSPPVHAMEGVPYPFSLPLLTALPPLLKPLSPPQVLSSSVSLPGPHPVMVPFCLPDFCGYFM